MSPDRPPGEALSSSRPWVPLLCVVSLALFMTSVDSLVVVTALPAIRAAFAAPIEELQWVVNAYTLSFAVLLLPGAAIGERFGRRRVFITGIVAFTSASAWAARAETIGDLVFARALQGLAAAFVLPLTLTLLNAAVPAARRGFAIGVWSGISGLGVALGPVVGGAAVQGASWPWIFWINVPVGCLLVALSSRVIVESRGQRRPLDVIGVGLVSAGLLGIVSALVRAEASGWTSAPVLGGLLCGAGFVGAFLLWESRTRAPMLPLHFFRSRVFTVVNAATFAMFFGTFGTAFFMAQYFQTGLGHGPLVAGAMTLPWTAAPLVVAPVAGSWADRVGARPLIITGLLMQAVGFAAMAMLVAPSRSFVALVPPLLLAGVGMSLVLAPSAAAVMGSVSEDEAGLASGATNAVREVGAVLGVAVLVSVFSAHGSYSSSAAFADGVRAALPWAAAALAAAAAFATSLPGATPASPAVPPRPITGYHESRA